MSHSDSSLKTDVWYGPIDDIEDLLPKKEGYVWGHSSDYDITDGYILIKIEDLLKYNFNERYTNENYFAFDICGTELTTDNMCYAYEYLYVRWSKEVYDILSTKYDMSKYKKRFLKEIFTIK